MQNQINGTVLSGSSEVTTDKDYVFYNTYEDEQEALTEVLSYRGYTQPEQFQFSTEKEFV